MRLNSRLGDGVTDELRQRPRPAPRSRGQRARRHGRQGSRRRDPRRVRCLADAVARPRPRSNVRSTGRIAVSTTPGGSRSVSGSAPVMSAGRTVTVTACPWWSRRGSATRRRRWTDPGRQPRPRAGPRACPALLPPRRRARAQRARRARDRLRGALGAGRSATVPRCPRCSCPFANELPFSGRDADARRSACSGSLRARTAERSLLSAVSPGSARHD